MRLIYIANIRIPHNRAHSIQVSKMSEAFNKQIPATLIVPLKFTSSRSKTYSDYNIKSRFKITYIPSIDFIFLNLGIFFFYLQSISFSFIATLYSLFLRKDFYYTRDIFTAYFLVLSRFMHRGKIFYEAHGEHSRFENLFVKYALRNINGIVAINQNAFSLFKDINKNIIIAHDGVDISMFDVNNEKKELKKLLNIDSDKKIILYSGHLYKWKGIYSLLDSMQHLPDDFQLYILGGTSDDINSVKQYIKNNNVKNTILLGHVLYNKVPQFISAADILVLPNSARYKWSSLYTSPLKLFEYMASRNIIVASEVQSIKEVLNENNSILVKPDDSKELAEGIKQATNKMIASKLTERAYLDVEKYSWDNRVRTMLSFFNQST